MYVVNSAHLSYGINFSLFAKPSRLHSFPTGSIEINILIFDARSSSSPQFRSDFSASLARILRRWVIRYRSSQRQPRKKSEIPRLLESEPRESLNDVTFVVSLPRRRAFARLNCKLRLHSPSICPPSPPPASSHGFRSQKPFYRSPPPLPPCPRRSWKIYILRVGGLTNSLLN